MHVFLERLFRRLLRRKQSHSCKWSFQNLNRQQNLFDQIQEYRHMTDRMCVCYEMTVIVPRMSGSTS